MATFSEKELRRQAEQDDIDFAWQVGARHGYLERSRRALGPRD